MDEIWTLRPLLDTPVLPWFALAVGLIVGSFANVCIHRLPLGLSVVSPRSRCPRCGRAIRSIENVPVLSWLALRGRCRGCRAPISVALPAGGGGQRRGLRALAWGWARSPRTVVLMAPVHRAARAGPHRPRPPHPARRDHASGHRGRAPGQPAARASLAARVRALGRGWLPRLLRGRARVQPTRGVEGLGQGDWKMVAMLGAFLGWQGHAADGVPGRALGDARRRRRSCSWAGGRRGTRLPLGTFLAAGGHRDAVRGRAARSPGTGTSCVSERRRPSLRIALLVVLLLLGLIEVQSVAPDRARPGAAARARHPHSREARDGDVARDRARPAAGRSGRWQSEPGDPPLAVRASEAELLDLEGRALAAHPGPAPIVHWPSAERVQSIAVRNDLHLGPRRGAAAAAADLCGLPVGRSASSSCAWRRPSRSWSRTCRSGASCSSGTASVLVLLAIAAGLVLLPEPSPPSSRGVEALRRGAGAAARPGTGPDPAHRVERDRLTGEMRDLEAMARAGELTAGIVHEVRNGLGTILGYARLLEQPGAPAERGRRGATASARSARRWRRSCAAFMDFVRRETLQVVRFDLGRLLERVAAREQSRRPGASGDAARRRPTCWSTATRSCSSAPSRTWSATRARRPGERGRVDRRGRRRCPEACAWSRSRTTARAFPRAPTSLRPFVSMRAGGTRARPADRDQDRHAARRKRPPGLESASRRTRGGRPAPHINGLNVTEGDVRTPASGGAVRATGLTNR